MQWSEILDEIKRTLKEPLDNGHWHDNELKRRANLIQTEIVRQTKCIIKTVNITVANGSFSVPADLIKICDVVCGDKRLYGTTVDQLDADFEMSSCVWRELEGDPKRYYQDFNVIKLFPQDSSVTTIKLRYFGLADDMVEYSDKPFNGVDWLQDGGQAIIDGVVFRCLLEDDDNRYQTYLALYKEGIKNIKDKLMVDDKLEFFNLERVRR